MHPCPLTVFILNIVVPMSSLTYWDILSRELQGGDKRQYRTTLVRRLVATTLNVVTLVYQHCVLHAIKGWLVLVVLSPMVWRLFDGNPAQAATPDMDSNTVNCVSDVAWYAAKGASLAPR